MVRTRKALGIAAVLALVVTVLFAGCAFAGARLDRVMETKILRIGTPGDYRPFAMLDKATGKYEGHDIDLVELLAADLGVKVEYVATSWPKLMEDYLADRFDIAVGGVTRIVPRMLKGDFLPPYAPNGKVAVIRKADKEKFASFEKMDVPETTVILNPGGTNEKFVKANFKKAKVVMHAENAEIPAMIAEGKGDVMITDIYEAVLYAKKDSRLYTAFADKPLTKLSFKGFFVRDDDPAFLKIMNFLWNDAKLRGDLDALFDKWLR